MRPFMSFKGFDRSNPVHRKAVKAKLNEFFARPQITRDQIRAKVSELTSKGDTDAWDGIVNSVDVFQTDVGHVDEGWMAAFDEVDLRNTPKSSFDITDVSSGLTFSQVRPGGRARIYQVSGAIQNVPLNLYGGGLGFLQTWWDDQEFYKVTEAAADFMQKYNDQMRTVHYALITAITTAVSYDATGATTAEKDANTINTAAATLITNNEASLPQVNDGTNYILYAHPSLKARVMAALRTVIVDNPAAGRVVFNVRPVFSSQIGSGYLGQLVAPGLKNKFGRRMDLEVYSDFDITQYANTAVGWGRYGSFVNSAQVLRVPSS